MIVKEIWTELDFEIMGWHDSWLYAISFPNEHQEFSLDIDYLFDTILDKNSGHFNFWISPCTLTFQNVTKLKIDIDFGLVIGLDILEINRVAPRLWYDGTTTVWDFEITTSQGSITFESTGYRQVVKKQPMFSSAQTLERKKW